MSDIRPARGTHDFLGDEALRFLKVKTVFDLVAKSFNFQYVETPIFEALSVFDRTLGESSDIVSKEMYVFEDRGGDKLSLRPEGTAGVVRAFISNSLQRSLPLKFYYAGPMFRYERPQKGRYRQFNQLGIEVLGLEGVLADLEVLQFSAEFLRQLNLSGKVTLEINSLGSSDCRKRFREKLVQYYEKQLSALSEDSKRRLTTNPLRILDSKDPADIKINEKAPRLSENLSSEAAARFSQIQTSLKTLGISFSVNERLVRGLDYYNDLVFEFKTDSLGAQDAILSGGRYDGLVETMGGPKTPGVGFGAGVERLMMLLKSVPSASEPIAIAPIDEAAVSLALQSGEILRERGFSTEFIHSGNLSKRLQKATKAKARSIIIIGEEELKTGKLTYKDLKTSEQKSVSLSDLKSMPI